MGLRSGLIHEARVGIGVVRRLPGLSHAERLKLLRAAALLPVASRLPTPRAMSVPARLPDGSVSSFSLEHTTDLVVVSEVLNEGQYARPVLTAPAVIIDAGAHIGTSVSYFATKYPSARVIGLEASPRTFRRLKKHVARLPNVEVLNVALGGHDGVATFFERGASWSSSIATASSVGEGAVEVPMLTLESVLSTIGADYVDLLKLDIEGAEYETLSASPPDPRRIGAIVGELHVWMDDVTFTDTEFFSLLNAYDVEDDQSGGDRVFRATAKPVLRAAA